MTDRLAHSIFGSAAGSADGGRDAPQPPDPEPPRRARNRRGRSTLGRRLVVLLVAVAVLAAGGYLAVSQVKPLFERLTAPKDYPGAGAGAVRVVIKPNDTGRAIAATLEASGVVLTAGAFEDALTANPGAELQPGSYLLRSQMSAAQALALLRDPASRSVIKVTVREGLWKSEVFALLSKATGQPPASYSALDADPTQLGLPRGLTGLEGLLFPATYSFDPDQDAEDQLRTMVNETVKQLTILKVPEAAQPRVLTVASIIEGEAGRDTDRAKVSRVIANRLAAKMRLQMDSTVSYGVQRRAITTTDAERASKNGYNTYARDGLPVGPIGNPGVSSLKAALAPTPGPWLYFTTVNPATGETRFESTAAEHAVNVKVFQAWCQANPGTC